MLEIIQMILEKGPEVIGYAVVALGALYSIALMIPGEQPDKAIKWLLDITTKFSKK